MEWNLQMRWCKHAMHRGQVVLVIGQRLSFPLFSDVGSRSAKHRLMTLAPAGDLARPVRHLAVSPETELAGTAWVNEMNQRLKEDTDFVLGAEGHPPREVTWGRGWLIR